MLAVGSTIPASPVPKRRRSLIDLPLGGGNVLRKPDLAGACSVVPAGALGSESDLVAFEAAGLGDLPKSRTTIPGISLLMMLSFLSANDGAGPCANTEVWQAKTAAAQHSERSVRLGCMDINWLGYFRLLAMRNKCARLTRIAHCYTTFYSRNDCA